LERVLEEIHDKLASSPRLWRPTKILDGGIDGPNSAARVATYIPPATRIAGKSTASLVWIAVASWAFWSVNPSSLRPNDPCFHDDDEVGTTWRGIICTNILILQWAVQREDLIEVDGDGETYNDITTTTNNNCDTSLRERLFDGIKPQISALLDGVFTIIPRSFLFVFRSVEELEECISSSGLPS
jgi:hypothetical protein